MSSLQTLACAVAMMVMILPCSLAQTPSVPHLDESCLGCLCEASSNCSTSAGCTEPYPGGFFCGPFLISRGYWTDAGKPILGGDDPNRESAFANCANDIFCAADTVINYMSKFRQDCNGDGLMNCDDYAHIHVLGGYGCKGQDFASTPFYERFQRCRQVLLAASSP
ncbi:Invertebrate-type lysozyme [Trinorchestia longiramus]|nr:Invertebrate-type lysozyme [Trinorchestia longiramus]